MKASEIMTKDVVTISGSATVATAVKLMKKCGLRSLIVQRRHEEDAYGIVTEIDIIQKIVAFGKNAQQVRVYEIMTKPCIVVNPDLAIEYVARLLANANIDQAPVIKDDLLGIISVSDILNKSDFIEQPKELLLEQEIKQATEKARTICQEKGHTNECLEAWQLVQELQAEAAYQQGKKLEKTAFEEYVEKYPEASDGSMLDNWCSG